MVVYGTSIPLVYIHIALAIVSVIYLILGWFAVKRLNTPSFTYYDFIFYSIVGAFGVYLGTVILAYFRII